jgi:hypothetical protein
MQVPPGTKGALANKHGSIVPEGTLDFLVIEIPARRLSGLGYCQRKTLNTRLGKRAMHLSRLEVRGDFAQLNLAHFELQCFARDAKKTIRSIGQGDLESAGVLLWSP